MSSGLAKQSGHCLEKLDVIVYTSQIYSEGAPDEYSYTYIQNIIIFIVPSLDAHQIMMMNSPYHM